MSDPLADARATIATLQMALDRAHTRVRELEAVAATLNERLAVQTECRDAAELHVLALTAQPLV